MTAIDQVLQDAVARGDVPGVIAMATDGKDITYQGAFGERELAGGRPMQLDTVCWIHSMTKAITGACLMQLVEQGRIGLDDDCGRLVPALANPRVLDGFDANDKPILRPARGAITLRRLMTHTSGFVYDNWNADMLRYNRMTGLSRVQTFARPEDCQPLSFDPGTAWHYGIGLEWAGKVLEAITGTSLDDYMQANVLRPLGMASTGYRLTPAIRERLSGVHQRRPDGRLEVSTFDAPQRPEDFMGGGGLYSTAGDYLRFIRMVLNGGSLDGVRLLKPETIEEMGRNHIGGLAAGVLKTASPAMSFDADLFPGMSCGWGLSYLINPDDLPGRRAGGSLTWAGLRNSYFWIDPKSGIGGTLFTQILPFADPKTIAVYEAFEREIYRAARR
ncbi:MAG: beta-lactamase family protein [Proteobacteria bacterium]|nr:beta-lactamase family protein [Pseudomonadota bacterium]